MLSKEITKASVQTMKNSKRNEKIKREKKWKKERKKQKQKQNGKETMYVFGMHLFMTFLLLLLTYNYARTACCLLH